jgi:plastocyanin
MAKEGVMARRPPAALVVLIVPIVALIAVVVTRAVEGPSDATVANAGAHSIVIKNFSFHPQTLSVAKGTTVKVTNSDGTTHTFSARNGSFNTGDLSGGAQGRIRLNDAGTFAFYCKIHNYMTGTLVVK